MRDFKGMKRQRGRNRSGGAPPSGKPQQNANRAFDSAGPENIKVRGHAQSVYEKYQQLARDAFSSGDRVLAESHLQHAEHYFRLLRLIQPNRPTAEIVARDVFASGFDIDFEDEGGAQFAPEPEAQGGEANGIEGAQPLSDGGDASPEQGRDRPRFDDRGERGRQDRYQGDRNLGDRNLGDRNQGERQQGDRYQGDRDRAFTERDRGAGDRGDRAQGDRFQNDRAQGDRYQNGGRNDRYDRGQGDRTQNDRYQADRPQVDRPQGDRTQSDRQQGDRQQGDRSQGDRFQSDRQDRPRRDGRDRNRNDYNGGDGRGERGYEARDGRNDGRGRPEFRAEAERAEADRPEPPRSESGGFETTTNPYPEAVVTTAPAYVEPETPQSETSAAQLRSEDGGFSEAPAFLQALTPLSATAAAPDAPDGDAAPVRRARRPRRPRIETLDASPAEDNLPPGPPALDDDER